MQKKQKNRIKATRQAKKDLLTRNLYETRQDVFIYKDGRTKSGRYYVRIYDARTKRTHSESLRTTNRIEALSRQNSYIGKEKMPYIGSKG